MKRVLLVFASLLIGLTTASATEQHYQKPKIKFNKNKNYRFAQPIIFMERGVEFLIFPDGSFDFNTTAQNNFDDNVYYRSNSRRSNININHRGPNATYKYSATRYPNRGVHISRDRNGTVRRIGHVFLNYDRRGRITRAGSVFMNYNRGRHGNLSRVGGMQVDFNKRGEITYAHGQINRFNTDCNFANQNNNHNNGWNNNDWNNNSWNDNDNVYNDDYYYFKQNGKVRKHKKNKIYKR